METFLTGDRVVAINTDHSGPICGPPHPELHPFRFPDGPLRQGPIYHVSSVGTNRNGGQALCITGLRVLWGKRELPWDGSRFRKVDSQQDFLKAKKRQKGIPAISC